MNKTVTILHLYPDEMNIYGDRGNVLTLVRRLEWRGFKPVVLGRGIGETKGIDQADIIFAGGGQDKGQIAVGQDLLRSAGRLHRAAEKGIPMLTVCGTYQLFGKGFKTAEGEEIPGIEIFGATTTGSSHRMIGNIVIQTEWGQLVGFENHSGKTVLEAHQSPLGKIIKGYGNDGRSGYEGARFNNVLGTYLHGPILPKNPVLADFLIKTALTNRYGVSELAPLDDAAELQAAMTAAKRPK